MDILATLRVQKTLILKSKTLIFKSKNCHFAEATASNLKLKYPIFCWMILIESLLYFLQLIRFYLFTNLIKIGVSWQNQTMHPYRQRTLLHRLSIAVFLLQDSKPRDNECLQYIECTWNLSKLHQIIQWIPSK